MSEENEPISAPGRASVDVDIHAPTQLQQNEPTEAAKSFLERVPLDYKDKPWVSELVKANDPTVELFKKVENLQELAGRKGEGLKVPAADAPDAEKQAFYKALGVPEKAEDYIYEAPKAPEGQEQYYQVDNELIKTLQERALKGGMTPQAWKEITEAYNENYVKTVNSNIAQFDSMLKDVQNEFATQYGEKSPQVLATLDSVMSKASDKNKALLQALQPATKAALADAFHKFAEAYVREDKLDTKGMATGPRTMTEDEYGDEFEKKFAELRGAEKKHGLQSAEYLRAKSALSALQLQGKDIFKGAKV